MGGLLLTPRAADAQAPAAATTTVPAPAETTTSGRADDRSPRVRRADKTDVGPVTPEPDGAEALLSPELALADILPFTPTLGAGSTIVVPAPTGPVPAGEAVADYGRAPRSHWPLVAGMVVSLAILFGGGGALWWRNRDSHYWPA
jgi:hypothetical protein